MYCPPLRVSHGLWAANSCSIFLMLLLDDMSDSVSSSNRLDYVSMTGWIPRQSKIPALTLDHGTLVDNEALFVQMGFEAVACMTWGDCLINVLAHVWLVQHVHSQCLVRFAPGWSLCRMTMYAERMSFGNTTSWPFISMSFSLRVCPPKQKKNTVISLVAMIGDVRAIRS